MVNSERVCLGSSHDEFSGKRLRSYGKARVEDGPCLTTTSNASALQRAQCRLCIAILLSNSCANSQVSIFIDKLQNNYVE
jgi:hypothetical protein